MKMHVSYHPTCLTIFLYENNSLFEGIPDMHDDDSKCSVLHCLYQSKMINDKEMNLLTTCMHKSDVWNCVIDPEGILLRKSKRDYEPRLHNKPRIGPGCGLKCENTSKAQNSCTLKPQFRTFFFWDCILASSSALYMKLQVKKQKKEQNVFCFPFFGHLRFYCIFLLWEAIITPQSLFCLLCYALFFPFFPL